jgi:L-lysine 2,3-aminomutase
VLKGASPAAKLPTGPRTLAFRKRFYPDIPTSQWNNWQWQLQNRIVSPAALERILVLSDDERRAVAAQNGFPWAVTPYFASLLDPADPARDFVHVKPTTPKPPGPSQKAKVS